MNTSTLQTRKEAQTHIEQMLQDSISTFTLHPTKRMLTSQSNSDQALASSYHGRELLELLQNADDAFIGVQGGKKSRVLIEYNENILRISNVGKTFDKDSIERLCQGNASSKGIQYIGNKGIGFRSLLNWAHEIKIYSGDYSVGFSSEFAAKQLENLKEHYEKIREEVDSNPSVKFPVLWAPYWVEGEPEDGFDTTIEILLGENTQNDEWSLANQIDEFDYNVLLFLQNLTEVTIRVNGVEYLYCKEDGLLNGMVTNTVQKFEIGERKILVDSRCYYFFKRNDEIIDWDEKQSLIKASLAIPVDLKPIQSPFYTFFPVKDELNPFPSLMHCTFLLTQERNGFVNHFNNEKVMLKLLEFYVETVCSNFCKVEFGNVALDLLNPRASNIRFGVMYAYKAYCKVFLKLQNVNNHFIPISEEVKLYDYIPSPFCGPLFEKLCKPIEDESQKIFVQSLIGDKNLYSRDELATIINAYTSTWTVDERVSVFYWWVNHYNRYTYDSKVSPHLLMDNAGNWIDDQQWKIFVPDGDKFFVFPNWVHVKILDSEYADSLIKQMRCNYSNAIEMLNLLEYYEFKKLDLIEMLPMMVDLIRGNIDRSSEFIRWCRKFNVSYLLKSSDAIFPCTDGSVNSAEKIFLDEPYCQNPLKNILLSNGIHQLCAPETLLNDGETFDESKDSLFRFLFRFSFVKYPEIYEEKLRFWIWRKDDYIPRRKFAERLDEQLQSDSNHEGHESGCWLHGATVQTVDNIKDILENLSTVQVLQWLFDDNDSSRKLHSYVSGPEVQCDVEYMYGKKQNARIFKARSYHYLRYIFTYSKWLCLDESGERFAPCECKFTKSPLEKSLLKTCISDDDIRFWAKACKATTQDVRKLLSALGCSDSYMALPPQHFYDLLLKLPQVENVAESRRLSYTIYNNCIEFAQNAWESIGSFSDSSFRETQSLKDFVESDAAKNFAEKGQLLCGQDRKYHSVSELYYAGFPALNSQEKLFLDFPIKKDCAGLIANIFKVNMYKEEWDVGFTSHAEDVSPLNDAFQREWVDFVPYVLSLFSDSKREKYLDALRAVHIQLVSRLWDNDGVDVSSRIVGYHVINADEGFLIFVGNSTKLNRFELALKVTEILSTILTDAPQKQLDRCSELFRSDNDSRRGLIRLEIAGEDLLEECRLQFLAANAEHNSLKLFLIERKIDFETISSILDLLYNGLPLTLENQGCLSRFLQENSLDINDFKNVLNQQNITVEDYNRECLNKIFHQRKYEFEWAMWRKVACGTLEDKKQFRQKLDSIKIAFNEVSVENSVTFNPESAADNLFETLFGVFPSAMEFGHIEEIYKKHCQQLTLPVGSSKKLEDFLDDEYKSLLYFDVEKVQVALSEWAKEDSEQMENEPPVKTPKTAEVSFDAALVPSTAIYSPKKVDGVRGKKSSSKSQGEATIENQGDSAEHMIVKMLRGREIQEICHILDDEAYDVEWVSTAAERIEHSDGDDSLGYDVQLCNKSGKILYVDVKSHSGEDCTFRMSANEIRFAEVHATDEKDEYRIIFVANMDSDKCNVSVLPRDFLTNEAFERENLDVRFFYKEEEK